jgi:hypothetical protein
MTMADEANDLSLACARWNLAPWFANAEAVTELQYKWMICIFHCLISLYVTVILAAVAESLICANDFQYSSTRHLR